MRALLLVGLASALACFGQQQSTVPPAEQQELQQAIAEAGDSPVEFLNALEAHLRKYPNTKQHDEIVSAILRTAVEQGDRRRLAAWGPAFLDKVPGDWTLLESVSRALIDNQDDKSVRETLALSQRLEQAVAGQPDPPDTIRDRAAWFERKWQMLGKALVYQARATGTLGKIPEAEALARRSYEAYPSAEAAREIGRWLEREGKLQEAVERLADGFTISDPMATPEHRAKDRERMGEWYRKWKGSEAGLGEIVLAAWDRTSHDVERLRARLKEIDPNFGASKPMDFVLDGAGGDRLDMAKLAGKVVVIDFWATWCQPCRAQQPLYDEVKKRFHDNPDVVFLNLSTDDDRNAVKPFLAQMKWDKTVYFESGLGVLLRVGSIPTTVVLGRQGEVAGRLQGFIADRFVDMLSERIKEALAEPDALSSNRPGSSR